MKFKHILFLVVLLYLVASVAAIGPMAPTKTEYEYDVKVQQAYDVDRVEDKDVTEFDELSQDEQDVLYEAFKEIETGSMFGENGAEVTVVFDEQREVFDTWRSVEVNGIVLLVAVDEDIKENADSSIPWVFWWQIFIILSIIYLFLYVFTFGFAT